VLIKQVKVLHPTQNKIGHFGDIFSQPMSWLGTEKNRLVQTTRHWPLIVKNVPRVSTRYCRNRF